MDMKRIRVLSVEDEPDLQRLLSFALKEDEFEVHLAYDGPQGLQKAVALKPHVILCDLMLPGYDGRELITRLRDYPGTKDIPVIVVTAYADDERFREADLRALGVRHYLRKPVPNETLVRLLRETAAPR